MLRAISRGADIKPAKFSGDVNRNSFLLGCLEFTNSRPEEHLIVGYGWRYGNTTVIERVHHVVGQERSVQIPTYVCDEVKRHYHHDTDAEVVIYHNHPRTGDEADWLYFLKTLLNDLPMASAADRQELARQAYNWIGLARTLLGQGRIMFYLGESRYVRQFQLPRVLPFLEQLDQLKYSAAPA